MVAPCDDEEDCGNNANCKEGECRCFNFYFTENLGEAPGRGKYASLPNCCWYFLALLARVHLSWLDHAEPHPPGHVLESGCIVCWKFRNPHGNTRKREGAAAVRFLRCVASLVFYSARFWPCTFASSFGPKVIMQLRVVKFLWGLRTLGGCLG